MLKRGRNLLWFLFLLSIISQLGKHFWPNWSLVLGIRVDYLSVIFYLSDLLWLGLLSLELKNNLALRKVLKRVFSNKGFWFLVVLLVTNVIIADNPWVVIYGWLRLGQLLLMMLMVRKSKKLVNKLLKVIIPCWIVIESLLVLGQIAKGGSLGSWWWYLGERTFTFNTIGIAQMSVFGRGLIRGYGTFSHPNSLAGFLLVSLIWWGKFKKEIEFRFWWWIVAWLGLMGIILTGSRVVALLTLIVVILYLKSLFRKKRNFYYSLGTVSLLLIFVAYLININYPLNNFLGGWDENGLLKRGELNMAAIEMIKEKPFLGVGLNNFLVRLPEFQEESQIFWLQPVHNILLLMIVEMGWLISLVFFFLLFKYLKKKRIEKWQWLILGVIVATGMMDHYWMTLSQNRWLLFLFLGLF